MKNKIPLLFDLIFLFASAFLITLALSGWVMPRVPGFLTAFAVAGIATLLTYRGKTRRENRFALKKKDERAAEALAVQMNFNSLAENLAILETAAKKADLSVKREKTALRISDKKLVLFPRFSFDGVTKAEIALAFTALAEEETAVVISAGFPDEIKKFTRRFNGKVRLADGAVLFAKLKEQDALPPITRTFTPKKRTAAEWLQLVFLKSSSRGYFTAGAMLLILSFIVPYHFYYVISGTVLTLFALFLRFFGRSPNDSLPE